jgi:hypothetical protein
MATINVSTEVVLDGVVAAVVFTVIRRRQWTDSSGIEHHQHRRIYPVYGSLFPGGDNAYSREEADQYQNKGLEIITQFLLRAVAETADSMQWQPDIIRWNGDTFLVEKIEDFSSYGVGFVHASAASFSYVGVPPQGSPVTSGWLNFSDRKYSGLSGVAR